MRNPLMLVIKIEVKKNLLISGLNMKGSGAFVSLNSAGAGSSVSASLVGDSEVTSMSNMTLGNDTKSTPISFNFLGSSWLSSYYIGKKMKITDDEQEIWKKKSKIIILKNLVFVIFFTVGVLGRRFVRIRNSGK